MNASQADHWALAAKIGGVLALAGSLLRWLLTPAFLYYTRRALEPEITAMRQMVDDLRAELRELRERVDDLADGRR